MDDYIVLYLKELSNGYARVPFGESMIDELEEVRVKLQEVLCQLKPMTRVFND